MGRNAIENQMLLSKVASASDMWLHLAGRPSAHVIIKNQKGKVVPDGVVEEAARWLATTALGQKGVSKGANSGEKIEVLYTAVKWVRAVKGAPGKVTLQRSQTRLVQL
jgi:predicted ribosome quality control (RQC) complex YloA/Tae2 family protein